MQICKMSKYLPLWEYVSKRNDESFSLSFDEMEALSDSALTIRFLHIKKSFPTTAQRLRNIHKGAAGAFRKGIVL